VSENIYQLACAIEKAFNFHFLSHILDSKSSFPIFIKIIGWQSLKRHTASA